MENWNQRPSGLLVPAFPGREPVTSLPAGWTSPKTKDRIYTHHGPPPADPQPGSWSFQDLHAHVRGRAESTAQLLLGVAVLKQRGSIWNYVVGRTGAVWQDWEGNGAESHRAHRAPCNPIIGNQSVPNIAPTPAMSEALIAPLAKTDFLPMVANYADSRFEALGGADALTSAVRLVVKEQERNKPIQYDLFRHALLGIALPGYRASYHAVQNELVAKINHESAATFRSRVGKFNSKAPTHDLESVQEAASELTRFTDRATADLLHAVPFRAEVERLNDLASTISST